MRPHCVDGGRPYIARVTAGGAHHAQGTTHAQKNEILFAEFHINYNNEHALFRKGTILYRVPVATTVQNPHTGEATGREKHVVQTFHEDIIGDAWWEAHQALFVRD